MSRALPVRIVVGTAAGSDGKSAEQCAAYRPGHVTYETNQLVNTFNRGYPMATTDSVFQRALTNMLTEVFDGPPGQEAYLLNPGDSGLLRQLDTIDASAASKRPMPGKTTIAAHADHVHFGLAIL